MDETCEKLRYGRYGRISSCSSKRSRCLFNFLNEVSNSINGESTVTSQRLPLFYRLIAVLHRMLILFGHQRPKLLAIRILRFQRFRQRNSAETNRQPQVESPRTYFFLVQNENRILLFCRSPRVSTRFYLSHRFKKKNFFTKYPPE